MIVIPRREGKTRPTKLHIKVDINLIQHVPQIDHARIRQHDELQVRRRLEVVQLVDGGAVGDEVVVRPAQLAHHVPQREDGAEDQLRVVFGAQAWASAGAVDAVA